MKSYGTVSYKFCIYARVETKKIDIDGGSGISIYAVSDSGQIAGTCKIDEKLNVFFWDNGSVKKIGKFEEYLLNLGATNDKGQIVGSEVVCYT